MSCCGKKRAQLTGAFSRPPASGQTSPPAAGPARQAAPPPARSSSPAPMIFEYLGSTAVTVKGPVTQQLYRFDGPRARVAVDARDAAAVAGVPNLRRVR